MSFVFWKHIIIDYFLKVIVQYLHKFIITIFGCFLEIYISFEGFLHLIASLIILKWMHHQVW